MGRPLVGVLALQGCVQPHRAHLEAAGAEFREVRFSEDLESISGLILPGGESTTMLKLISVHGLAEPLRKAFERVPVWGICAGAILLARKVRAPEQPSFGLVDVEIQRNGFGRQLESFNARINDYEVSFIRAPRFIQLGSAALVRASFNNEPVWIEQGRHQLTSFHPELSLCWPSPWHRALVSASGPN